MARSRERIKNVFELDFFLILYLKLRYIFSSVRAQTLEAELLEVVSDKEKIISNLTDDLKSVNRRIENEEKSFSALKDEKLELKKKIKLKEDEITGLRNKIAESERELKKKTEAVVDCEKSKEKMMELYKVLK